MISKLDAWNFKWKGNFYLIIGDNWYLVERTSISPFTPSKKAKEALSKEQFAWWGQEFPPPPSKSLYGVTG